MKKIIATFILSLFVFSCAEKKEVQEYNLDALAETYVKLALNLGDYDEDYIDAYFGPPNIKTEAEKNKLPLEEIITRSDSLLSKLKKINRQNIDSLENLRVNYIISQLTALNARAEILNGETFDFDKESKLLYGVEAPMHSFEYYDKALKNLDSILKGEGTLKERIQNIRDEFLIDDEKIEAVFDAAVEEARKRTLKQVEMPKSENFKVEYVKDKPWGGYNWFKGDATSLIQVNLDLPKTVDGFLHLACHEGYPGHHVYHALIEKLFYKDKGWLEFSVYPLFTPQATLSEGLANYGIKVAFPGDEKIEFEKTVLCEIAGLDCDNLERYINASKLMKKLNYSTIDVSRKYLNGDIDREEAVKTIMKYRFRTKERAEKNLDFVDRYRTYIITYYVGEDLCEKWVESKLKSEKQREKRWNHYKKLLTSPITPEFLMKDIGEEL